MDIVDRLSDAAQPSAATPSARRAGAGPALLYAGTLLLAASLLFSVQPMFTKRVLPLLGGTPAVWSIAMVVFQALLLAGYAYAHASIRWLPQRIGAALHIALLATGVLALPLAIAPGFETPPENAASLWLVTLLLASIGLPFFVLSASAPLLQAWYVRSGRQDEPYFLYRASNAGSFVALLAYPFLIEPLIGLDRQAEIWSVGYVALVGAILACAGMVRNRHVPSALSAPADAPSLNRRLAWIGLSAVPSGLLVATTAHISTDIAAIPLLWIMPLALYLLSFIVAFRSSARWPGRALGGIQVAATAFELLVTGLQANLSLTQAAVTLGLLFVNALLAHRAVYELRPEPARLTTFYLCTSLGGVLGGVFAALLAPWLFSGVYEYPILLVAALACRPGAWTGGNVQLLREIRPVLGIVAGVALLAMSCWLLIGERVATGILFGGLLFAFAIAWRAPRRTFYYGLAVALAGFLLPLIIAQGERHRSFFGQHRIVASPDGRFRLLYHGTTLHGAMRVLDDDGTVASTRPEPLTYYTAEGPIAQVIDIARAVHGATPVVSVVGLGAGSLACHARPGEVWRFFEIDPVVIGLATDPARFRYLSECTPNAEIISGDARLTLARRPNQASVLILDAFSSDAIPMHLLTGEALDIALRHLDGEGLLAFHISNRHFELSHALARLAADRGLRLFVRTDMNTEPFERRMRARAKVAIMTRDPAIEARAVDLGWSHLPADLSRRPWSDDYANAFEALLNKQRN